MDTKTKKIIDQHIEDVKTGNGLADTSEASVGDVLSLGNNGPEWGGGGGGSILLYNYQSGGMVDQFVGDAPSISAINAALGEGKDIKLIKTSFWDPKPTATYKFKAMLADQEVWMAQNVIMEEISTGAGLKIKFDVQGEYVSMEDYTFPSNDPVIFLNLTYSDAYTPSIKRTWHCSDTKSSVIEMSGVSVDGVNKPIILVGAIPEIGSTVMPIVPCYAKFTPSEGAWDVTFEGTMFDAANATLHHYSFAFEGSSDLLLTHTTFALQSSNT